MAEHHIIRIFFFSLDRFFQRMNRTPDMKMGKSVSHLFDGKAAGRKLNTVYIGKKRDIRPVINNQFVLIGAAFFQKCQKLHDLSRCFVPLTDMDKAHFMLNRKNILRQLGNGLAIIGYRVQLQRTPPLFRPFRTSLLFDKPFPKIDIHNSLKSQNSLSFSRGFPLCCFQQSR